MNLKEENDNLREILRRVYSYVPIPEQVRIDSALSQQSEPTPGERAAWIDNNVRGNPTLIQAMKNLAGCGEVEQAQAQDERECCCPKIGEPWNPEKHGRDCPAHQATRPAQPEQQPVEQWQVRYLLGQKVEERWWQDSTAERAAWCAEANAQQLAKGLPDVWEIRKFYTAPIAQLSQEVNKI